MLSVTFDVDHKVLGRGVYLAKLDRLGDVYAVTLDIRLRAPYREACMTDEEMHTFEHSYATAVRQSMVGKEDAQVLYFGPMGCATGFYLLFQLQAASEAELEEKVNRLPGYMAEAVAYLCTMKTVPAKNEYQCGNCYTLADAACACRLGEELGEILADVCQNGYTQYVRLAPETLAELEK